MLAYHNIPSIYANQEASTFNREIRITSLPTIEKAQLHITPPRNNSQLISQFLYSSQQLTETNIGTSQDILHSMHPQDRRPFVSPIEKMKIHPTQQYSTTSTTLGRVVAAPCTSSHIAESHSPKPFPIAKLSWKYSPYANTHQHQHQHHVPSHHVNFIHYHVEKFASSVVESSMCIQCALMQSASSASIF